MNIRSIFSLFSSDLAIDLGTANTLVFAKVKKSPNWNRFTFVRPRIM